MSVAVAAPAFLAAACGAVVAYAIVLGAASRAWAGLPLPRVWISWLRSTVAEEELELEMAIRPRRARRQDAAVAGSLLSSPVPGATASAMAASSATAYPS